jgi:hypothetical protein
VKMAYPIPLLAGLILLIWGCNSTDGSADPDRFSVKFKLASVPANLTLDSLEIRIAIGDTGKPQALTLDMATGTSKASVLAYPGESYSLGYSLYASGLEIGSGRDSGTLAKDMAIEIHPVWNQGKVESAKALRASGKLLPAYLDTAFTQALAGKAINITLDSAAGYSYTWYIRRGDVTLASGTGTHIGYLPADSLAGSLLNLKLVVKQGNSVIEERSWDIKVLAALSALRPIGIITRPDTASAYGTYARIGYDARGRIDSIRYYDTTAWAPGRESVAALAYTYALPYASDENPIRVVRTAKNETETDLDFSYDGKGRLLTLVVASASGNTSDSVAYPSDLSSITRSYAQGKIMREVRHVHVSEAREVDSIYSPGDAGLVLTGLIEYGLERGEIVNRRVYRKFGTLTPYESEWTLYNGIGAIAFRKHYAEGSSLLLQKTETFGYRADGLLDRMVVKDEVTGDIEKAVAYVYPSVGAAKRTAGGTALDAVSLGMNRALLRRLAEVAVRFPPHLPGL